MKKVMKFKDKANNINFRFRRDIASKILFFKMSRKTTIKREVCIGTSKPYDLQ